MGASIPTSCPCGEVHESKGVAGACRDRARNVLRATWADHWAMEYGPPPKLKDAPEEVWAGVAVVQRWLDKVGRRAQDDQFRKKDDMVAVPAGSKVFSWRWNKVGWHLAEEDPETRKQLGRVLCGSTAPSGRPLDNPPVSQKCPDCLARVRALQSEGTA